MYEFDSLPSRRGTASSKWMVEEDVLPMWVADMDFPAAPGIISAMQERLSHGVFGYDEVTDEWYDADIKWWDERHGLLKINPLIDWSEEQVWAYVREHRVPYNKLHDQGFPSIGCQPCTRAVKPGEDIRSGRWWWEDPQHRECGLHIKENQNSK